MDDVTSQRMQQRMPAGFDPGGTSPLYAESHQNKDSPLGLCGSVYVAGRVSPYGSYAGAETVSEGQAPTPFLPDEGEMTAQNDLDLEILLRGNLLHQQQQRISILETSLSSMCNEIQKYREQLQDLENDKGGGQKPQPKVQSRYWTAEEHHQFLVGLEKYGPRDVKSIAALVATRNATQVRTHAQKYFLRQARQTGDDEGDESKTNSRKRIMSETLETSRQQSDMRAQQSPELEPQEPANPGPDTFGGGFGAAMGYELGDFGASLEMSGHGAVPLGGDSPLRAFDEDLAMTKGPMLKRMKDSLERSSRSVSPSRLDVIGDLEEVNAENVAGMYERGAANHNT